MSYGPNMAPPLRIYRLITAGLAVAILAASSAPAFAFTPGAPLDSLRGTSSLVGFYAAWDGRARASLAAHLNWMAVFSPQWLAVLPGGELKVTDDPAAVGLLAKDNVAPAVMPLVSNAHDEIWDQRAADDVILNPVVRARFLERLAGIASERKFAGYVFDLESLTPQAVAAYPTFLVAARSAFAGRGLTAWVSVPGGAGKWPLRALSRAADAVVLLAYDACWQTSNPGPIAGDDWVAAILRARVPDLDPRHLIVALASYGYDWPEQGAATVLSVAEANRLARVAGVAPKRDRQSGNSTFQYRDAQGRWHTVWFVDAQSFARQRQMAIASGVSGTALWRLGLEDSRLWGALKLSPSSALVPAAGPIPHPCNPRAE
jgi:spore germination protein YaaH